MYMYVCVYIYIYIYIHTYIHNIVPRRRERAGLCLAPAVALRSADHGVHASAAVAA